MDTRSHLTVTLLFVLAAGAWGPMSSPPLTTAQDLTPPSHRQGFPALALRCLFANLF